MKTTDDVMLKLLCDKSPIERELYILQVLMYWLEREIVRNNYIMPNSETFSKYIKNADDILESLVRNYKNEFLLMYYNLSLTQYYMFHKHNYNLEDYLKDYVDKKGRLPLHNQPKYKKPWYKWTIREFLKFS